MLRSRDEHRHSDKSNSNIPLVQNPRKIWLSVWSASSHFLPICSFSSCRKSLDCFISTIDLHVSISRNMEMCLFCEKSSGYGSAEKVDRHRHRRKITQASTPKMKLCLRRSCLTESFVSAAFTMPFSTSEESSVPSLSKSSSAIILS